MVYYTGRYALERLHRHNQGNNMTSAIYAVEPIGFIHSGLTDPEQAPLQGSEGAPEAWLELRPPYAPALLGIAAGDELFLLTWLHRARRDVLQVHPRGDPARPLRGVFSTRSQDRPNPIGLHRVTVLEVRAPERRLRVTPLEAIDGTPIVDIKPVLSGSSSAGR